MPTAPARSQEIAKTAPVEFQLYNGKVNGKFYPDSHQYWVSVNGGKMERKTGVTTIIGIKDKSTALGEWQKNITVDYLFGLIEKGVNIDYDRAVEAVMLAEKLKKQAADIGHEIHEWAEGYIRYKLKQPGFKNLPEIPNFPEAVTGVNSFLEWEKKRRVKFISTETVVYSMEHDYIGIEDVTFEADGKFCDSDFKSSNGLYNGVRMQTVAYRHARMENGGRKGDGRWAIRFSKYSEEEYYAKEERKREVKKIIAKILGKEYKEYPIKPYQVFEAKYLDDDPSFMKRDMEAFLHAKALREWDCATDPFYKGENW